MVCPAVEAAFCGCGKMTSPAGCCQALKFSCCPWSELMSFWVSRIIKITMATMAATEQIIMAAAPILPLGGSGSSSALSKFLNTRRPVSPVPERGAPESSSARSWVKGFCRRG